MANLITELGLFSANMDFEQNIALHGCKSILLFGLSRPEGCPPEYESDYSNFKFIVGSN